MVVRLLLVLSAMLELQSTVCEDGPVVTIAQGTLQGTFLKSSNGRKIAAFQGIPYAEPPVGKHRFKDPEPAKPWRGVWNATHPGSMCLQYRRFLPPIAQYQGERILGEENCLYVNVYTPKMTTENVNANLDVIVYIHGGAFMYGWGHEYGPLHLLNKDVIMVTFNYRLGPLGFLSTEDEVLPGNMGMKDQVLALQWVQQNAAVFGGNPDSVTITGTSAGGASVHYHYLSPMSRGLFARGYSQSGSALCPWTYMEQGQVLAKKLASALGCNTTTSRELTECLRKRPARQIVQQTENFQTWMFNPFSPFAPNKEVGSVNPFLAKTPVDAILDGDVQNLPWIASVVTHEGLYPFADLVENPEFMKILEEQFSSLAPHILHYNFTVSEENKLNVLQRIIQHYLKQKSISASATELVKMGGDRLFVADTVRAAKLQAAVNSAPVYFYVFGYRGAHSISEHMSGTTTNLGVSHGDDTGYTISCFLLDPTTNDADDNMKDLLVDIWTSYARNSNPVPPARNFVWKPTTRNSKDIEYLDIRGPKNLKMAKSTNLGEQEFWDSLPIEEYQIGKNTPITMKYSEL